jgi:small-conductance mechanosensitive channel
MELLDKIILGNSLGAWAVSLGVLVLCFSMLEIIKKVIAKRLQQFAEKTETQVDDMLADIIGNTRVFFLFALSVYMASLMLTIPPKAMSVLKTLAVLAFLAQAAIWGTKCITLWITGYTRRNIDVDASSVTTIRLIGFISRLVLWSLVFLLALDNMGVDITALVAGMGIGGIAVALAAQNILGDLFASLAIVLDKPFVIGDFIIVGDLMGSVEYIGLKTTRVRSLSGEQLVFSNKDLLGSRIRNYKRMVERRVVFSVGVVYDTPAEKLAAIPKMIKDIIVSQDKTRFDRAHFESFGAYSLNFEAVYFVLSGDYNLYMDIQQSINMEIFTGFAKDGIEFAFPTQTLYVDRAQTETA